MNKYSSIITFISFAVILSAIGLWLLLAPDPGFSKEERRALESRPEISFFDTERSISDQLNGYYSDKIPFRPLLRNLKVAFSSTLLMQSSVDGYKVKNGSEYKIIDNSSIELAERNVKFISEIVNKYYSDSRVSYGVIPDKGYYAGEANHPDSDAIETLFGDFLPKGSTLIDMENELDFSSFYKTDIHVTQAAFMPAAKLICQSFGSDYYAESELEELKLGDFRGGLYGQACYAVLPDKMTVLSSSLIDAAKAGFNFESASSPLYDLDAFYNSADPYDVFLGGEKAVITINNSSCKSGRTLVIFRDSYARSIAPLLIKSYSKIILVDFRYMTGASIEEYREAVAPSGSDVLILLSSQIIGSVLYR